MGQIDWLDWVAGGLSIWKNSVDVLSHLCDNKQTEKSARDMKDIKGTDALEFIRKKYGNYPEFEEGVEKARTDLVVGQMIYNARQEAGLTQAELAELAGTTQSVISRLEDADYEGHSLPMLNRIAAALHKRVEIRFVHEPGMKA